MSTDRPRQLVEHWLGAAHEAALARDWTAVRGLVGDVLVLDPDNAEAMQLRTLVEHHDGRPDTDSGRRHETTLFADLVGSTAMANRLDQEVVSRVIREYELSCTPVLTALGGHVHRFVGDGILASFGYPSSHEDDARRAVRAGLDLVAAVAATTARLGATGIELAVRVGIASGTIVHVDRGDASWRQTGDLVGPAVNLAARLHDLAEPGEVCISAETARLVAGSFELADLGRHDLKGFENPVRVHRVVRTTSTGWAERADVAADFVGRRPEIALLEDRWAQVTGRDDAHLGADRSVFVSGEAGVGKSRLVREFLTSTASPERTVVEMQCTAYRTTSPLHPVAAAIARRCGFVPEDDDAVRTDKLSAVLRLSGDDMTEALPYVANLLEIGGPAGIERPEVSPAQLRAVTLFHLHTWIVAVAAREPTVLLVEDLHWADPSTDELLRQVVRSPSPGLLVLVTSRSEPAWTADAGFESLVLAPLTTAEARSMAGAAADGALPGDVVDEIARRSDGIPLFVEQLVDSLRREEGGSSPERRTIPLELTELLQARLDATGSSKRIAQLAATVGREFDPQLVAAMALALEQDGVLEPSDRPVAAHLERLLDSRLVEADPKDPTQLRFRHALVSDAAYESQLLEERPGRHAALARTMSAQSWPNARLAVPEIVAQHFERAGLPIDAITQYLQAATRDQAAGAFTEATSNLGRAEALLAEVDEPLRQVLELGVRLNRGLAVCSAAGYAAQGVIDDFARAVDLCQSLRRDRHAAPHVVAAMLGLWSYYCVTADLSMARQITSSIEEQVGHAEVAGGRPSIHLCRGVEAFYAGHADPAEHHLQTAVEQFDTDPVDPTTWAQPNDPVAAALAFLAPLRFVRGDERGALDTVEAAIERSTGCPFPLGPFSVAFVRMYESWLHRLRGDGARASAAAQEVRLIGEQHGFFDWVMTGRIHLAASRLAVEPSYPVLDEMAEATAVWQSVGGRLAIPALLVEQGFGYLGLGDVEQARRCADESAAAGRAEQRFGLSERHRLRAALVEATRPGDPAVVSELTAGVRVAADQGAHLFVVRCGQALSAAAPTGALPPDVTAAVERSRAAFDPVVLARMDRTTISSGPASR
jgi:class 3 adenylate cyclase